MPVSLSLEGRVALVSGASRGIGRAIALKIAECGASVVVNYLNSVEAADEVVADIIKSGGAAIAIKSDVSEYYQAQDLIKNSIVSFGKLDILVNNAGITRDKLIMLMTEEDWDDVQSTNLKSTFNCSKAAVKHMMRNRYGRIINITSVAGQMGNAGQTNYSASKAGSDHLVRAYWSTYNLPITISNCSNNFGPYQFPEKFIPLVITNVLAGEKIPLYGDGLHVRDWLYVFDHCEAIDLILHKGKLGETYLIGGLTKDISNLEIVRKILKIS